MLQRICNYCGKRLVPGQQCDCKTVQARLAERNKEAQERYDRTRRDKEAAAFYASEEWKAVRQAVWARAYGLDEYLYKTTGRVVKADTVHHIVELKDDRTLAYDTNNLICVSRQTHKLIHTNYRNRKRKLELQNELRAAIGALRNK